jgi:hypothetical protein
MEHLSKKLEKLTKRLDHGITDVSNGPCLNRPAGQRQKTGDNEETLSAPL